MLRIELLKKSHKKDRFDCGVKSLNDYLSRYARQNDQKSISRTFVAINNEKIIQGYYSICLASINFEELPENISNQLPRYPVPAARLSRLAVNLKAQGSGLGEHLLLNALKRIYLTSNEMGIKCIIVDSINEKAKSFYESYGFINLPNQDLKLFLLIDTVKKLFE